MYTLVTVESSQGSQSWPSFGAKPQLLSPREPISGVCLCSDMRLLFLGCLQLVKEMVVGIGWHLVCQSTCLLINAGWVNSAILQQYSQQRKSSATAATAITDYFELLLPLFSLPPCLGSEQPRPQASSAAMLQRQPGSQQGFKTTCCYCYQSHCSLFLPTLSHVFLSHVFLCRIVAGGGMSSKRLAGTSACWWQGVRKVVVNSFSVSHAVD